MAWQHLGLRSVKLISDLRPPESERINVCCVKASKCVAVRCSRHRKLIQLHSRCTSDLCVSHGDPGEPCIKPYHTHTHPWGQPPLFHLQASPRESSRLPRPLCLDFRTHLCSATQSLERVQGSQVSWTPPSSGSPTTPLCFPGAGPAHWLSGGKARWGGV